MKPCRACKLQIPVDATLCSHCMTHQSILGRLNLSAPVLGLLVALAGLGLNYLDYISDRIWPPESNLRFSIGTADVDNKMRVQNLGDAVGYVTKQVECNNDENDKNYPETGEDIVPLYLEIFHPEVLEVNPGKSTILEFGISAQSKEVSLGVEGNNIGWLAICELEFYDNRNEFKHEFKAVFRKVSDNITLSIHRLNSQTAGMLLGQM